MSPRHSRPPLPPVGTVVRCPRCDRDRPVREHLGRNYRVLAHCGHVIALIHSPEAR